MKPFWKHHLEAVNDNIEILSRPAQDYYEKIRSVIDDNWDDLQDLVNIQLAINKLSNDVNKVIMDYYDRAEPLIAESEDESIINRFKELNTNDNVILVQKVYDPMDNAHLFILSNDSDSFILWQWTGNSWNDIEYFNTPESQSWPNMLSVLAKRMEDICL